MRRSRLRLRSDLCLPSVRRLTVWGDRTLPFFTQFARICPNIRFLDLGSSWNTYSFPHDYTGDEDVPPWQYLECVHGLPDALGELPTAAPIHDVHLTHDGLSPRARSRLLVVYTAQPVSLSLDLLHDDGPDFFARMVQASPQLRHLCLWVMESHSPLGPLFVRHFAAYMRVALTVRTGSDHAICRHVEDSLPRAPLFTGNN